MTGVPAWSMAGQIIGACNCAWGCPCNFDAPPTYGHCDRVYTRGGLGATYALVLTLMVPPR